MINADLAVQIYGWKAILTQCQWYMIGLDYGKTLSHLTTLLLHSAGVIRVDMFPLSSSLESHQVDETLSTV